MTFFRSFGRPTEHGAPGEDGFYSDQLAVKDQQALRVSNLEVAKKHLVRTERLFGKHKANCFTKIVRQEPSGPGIVKQICSPLVKAAPPLLHRWQNERLRPYSDSSSAWMSLASSLLSAKKRITVRFSL
jgi:hypothetical protein